MIKNVKIAVFPFLNGNTHMVHKCTLKMFSHRDDLINGSRGMRGVSMYVDLKYILTSIICNQKIINEEIIFST